MFYEQEHFLDEQAFFNDELNYKPIYLCFMYSFFKIRSTTVVLSVFCFLTAACGPDEQTVIHQKVDSRVAEFVKKKKEECRISLLEQAEKIVDSLLLAEAQLQLRDSLNRARPFKPVEPIPVPPIDSAEIKPIFKKKD